MPAWMLAPVGWPRLGCRPEAALAAVGSANACASAATITSALARDPARLMPA
jgi:hypothetical protein